MKWSRNLQVRPNDIPEEISVGDWDPVKQAFPFENDATGPEGLGSDRCIRFDPEGVYIRLQRGPVHEAGINGAQIDDLLTVSLVFLRRINALYPCRENSLAITKLEECLMWLEARTRDREDRCVEGLSAL